VGNRLRTTIVSALLLMLAAAPGARAGVTGKISGLVKDTQSGQPVVGATVRVVGTDFTTTTDEDGEYFIINVPSGKYDIAVSYVGFESFLKKEVRVLVDLTTPVDFELRQTAVELKQVMVVYASNPLIQKDLTASKVIYTSDRLKNMPNVTTVQAVLTKYPGVVMDKNAEMHVRGGRSGQVSYYYDGFSVQDPFVANVGMRIVPTALEELSLTSGGFTAEYGEALSGVVSAVSPEGGSAYHGRFRMYEGVTHPYDFNTGKWGGLKALGNRSVSLNLSGPVPFANPEHYTFFAAGEYYRDPTSLPHNRTNSYSSTAKVTMQPTPRLKMTANAALNSSSGDLYTHRDVNGRSYDYNLDGLPAFRRRAYLGGFSGQYSFSDRSIVMANFNRFYTRTKQAPQNLMDVYWRYWPGYSEDSNGVYNGTIQDHNYLNNRDWTNPYEAVGFALGDDYNPTYRYREAAYNSFTASYLNQITKAHQLKFGVEYRQYDLNWDSKQFYNDKPYGELYTSKPTYASFYSMDKIEYADFVINLGMRFDYRNADISYNVTPGAATSTYRKAESRSRWSPRLGMSFPISEKSVMHFNYGIYYQEPRYQYMYTNLQGDVSTGLPLLGNPDLAPEQTVSYELGLDHLIGQSLRLDATAYYKDISDLITTRYSGQANGHSITAFDNGDYGSVKGFDVALDKLAQGSFFTASVAYSYMWATGNGSYALEPYYTFLTNPLDSLAPVKEYPLDFDQRHTLTATLDYRVPADWDGSLFGMKLPGAWGINLVGYLGSGLPYTKTDVQGNRLGDRNEGRLPANYSVDMRFNKDFAVSAKDKLLTFFVEIDNLFNRKNILNVYTRTGLADNDAQIPGTGLSLNANEVARLDRLYDHDPQNYSLPRTIRTGLEFSF
jgi:outer membrane receptor protein involved in Fe transport